MPVSRENVKDQKLIDALLISDPCPMEIVRAKNIHETWLHFNNVQTTTKKLSGVVDTTSLTPEERVETQQKIQEHLVEATYTDKDISDASDMTSGVEVVPTSEPITEKREFGEEFKKAQLDALINKLVSETLYPDGDSSNASGLLAVNEGVPSSSIPKNKSQNDPSQNRPKIEFACPVTDCGKVFLLRRSQELHFMNFHTDAEITLDRTASECPHCDKKVMYLSQHIRSVHGAICPVCRNEVKKDFKKHRKNCTSCRYKDRGCHYSNGRLKQLLQHIDHRCRYRNKEDQIAEEDSDVQEIGGSDSDGHSSSVDEEDQQAAEKSSLLLPSPGMATDLKKITGRGLFETSNLLQDYANFKPKISAI